MTSWAALLDVPGSLYLMLFKFLCVCVFIEFEFTFRILALLSDAGLSSASIEIAAGSRHFSDGCEKAGWQACAHDIIFDDKQDLRSPAYVQQQCDAAERGCYAIGHVGVCCTTFSRLANPPYRRHTDAAHPEFIVCLPDMSEKKTRKALEANLMADHSVTLLVAWHCSGMMASLENPHSSMIWQYFEHTGAMSRLQALGFRKFSTCYCRFGTPYQKRTCVYAITCSSSTKIAHRIGL